MKKSYFNFMKYLFLLFSLFLSANAFEEDNLSNSYEHSYIDEYHGYFDGKVHEWGVSVDSMVLGIYDFFAESNNTDSLETNSTVFYIDINVSKERQESVRVEENVQEHNLSSSLLLKVPNQSPAEEKNIDEFFLTRKLLEERDRSFVRISFLQSFRSRENEETKIPVQARLDLGRSEKRFRIFIEDLNEENAKNIGTGGVEENSPSIGVEVFKKDRFGIKPKYSIGFRGINLFARARYSYEKSLGRWRIEPVQTFTYSLKEEFSESTELYCDTPTSDFTLFRFLVDRGTQSYVKGMRYDGYVQWFWTPHKNRGFSTSLGFNGSTKYLNTVGPSYAPMIKEENRVFNYLLNFRWRENILKPWLFYEIGPGLNYHESHDFRPNYNIYFKIDLFFGHV